MAEGNREDNKDLKGHYQRGRMHVTLASLIQPKTDVATLSTSPSGQPPRTGEGWGNREVVRH